MARWAVPVLAALTGFILAYLSQRSVVREWGREAEQAMQLRLLGDLFAELPKASVPELNALATATNLFVDRAARESFRYAQTIERIADGVLTISVRSLAILSVNQSGVTLLGFRDAGEVVGESLAKLLVEPGQASDLLEPGQREFEARLPDGRLVVMASQASQTGEGEQASALLVFRNITAQRELEHALAWARDAAVEGARLKAEFLANMSHEIRTPMNGILGMTDILMESPLNPDQLDVAKTIANAADSLLRIINDILDFSKIEAGKLSIERVNFDLNALLDDIKSLLAAKVAEKSIQLAFEVQPGVPRFALGDPVRIRQVLLNLLSNSVKFTEKGRVILTVGTNPGKGEDWLDFRVTDTGIGMTEAQCATVFEKFVQADSSTTRKFGGTGLGLSITRQLVELMGGGILVESKQGVGSIFTVSLSVPRVTELICSLPPPAPLTTFVDVAMKVLLVEDNLVNQKVATRFLEKLGCKITVANNGQEALDAVQAEAFEIVFMDCQMPVMDGFDATRAIRRLDGPAGRSYIVAMTANAMVGDRERCLACGMNDYVTKPLRLPVLRQLMEAVVDLRTSEAAPARGVA